MTEGRNNRKFGLGSQGDIRMRVLRVGKGATRKPPCLNVEGAVGGLRKLHTGKGRRRR